jgi:hypothetical protein
MARRSPQKGFPSNLTNFVADNKGMPVFVGIGFALLGLILNCFSGLEGNVGILGWLVRSEFFLHLGVIVGLIGILLGDAL